MTLSHVSCYTMEFHQELTCLLMIRFRRFSLFPPSKSCTESFFFQAVSLVVTNNILFLIIRDGRIKLFGKNQTQALLVSEEASTSKFIEVLLTYIIYVFSLYNNNGWS